MAVQIWQYGNDMLVRLDRLQTSTMSSTQFMNNSTGVTVDVWAATSTGTIANRLFTGNAPFVGGSNGRYEVVTQSTGTVMALGTVGMVVVTLKAGTLDAQWRPQFRVDQRGST